MSQYTQEFLSKGYDSLRTLSLLDFDDFQYLKIQPAHHQILLYAARELQRKGADLPPTRDEQDVRGKRVAIDAELGKLRAVAQTHDVRRDAVNELSDNMTKRAAEIDKRSSAMATQREADANARHAASAKAREDRRRQLDATLESYLAERQRQRAAQAEAAAAAAAETERRVAAAEKTLIAERERAERDRAALLAQRQTEAMDRAAEEAKLRAEKKGALDAAKAQLAALQESEAERRSELQNQIDQLRKEELARQVRL